ncbi:MAG: hypothetical protein D6741_15405, partial [Planctomycetota bacterium]
MNIRRTIPSSRCGWWSAFFFSVAAVLLSAAVGRGEPRCVVIAALGEETAEVSLTVRSGTLRGRLAPGDIVVCFAREPLFISARSDGVEDTAERQVEPGELAVVLSRSGQKTPQILRFFGADKPGSIETETASRWWKTRFSASSGTGYRHVGRYWLLPGPAAGLRIPTKILVDDDEPAARTVWEARLRRRIEQA